MDEDKSLKEMIMVPAIIAVVLIIAVIIMNVLVDKKVENDKKNRTTTTTSIGKPDIYGAEHIVSEGLYNFDNTSDGGIIFFVERNENDVTLYYLNEDTSYLPCKSVGKLVKNDKDEYVEYYEFELDDVIIELTAVDGVKIQYKDSDGKIGLVSKDALDFSFEGIYENNDYKMILMASEYEDGNSEDSVKSFEFLSFIYDNENTYELDLNGFTTNNNLLPDSISESNVMLNGYIDGTAYTLNMIKYDSSYNISFNSDLFDLIDEENDYRKFNGTYNKR